MPIDADVKGGYGSPGNRPNDPRGNRDRDSNKPFDSGTVYREVFKIDFSLILYLVLHQQQHHPRLVLPYQTLEYHSLTQTLDKALLI